MKLYTFAKKVLREQLALGDYRDEEYLREAQEAIYEFENSREGRAHLAHCYQGEYEDGCKYGESNCPASKENTMNAKESRRFGDVVYHVANPEVPGIIAGPWTGDYVGVRFSQPVGFSGNEDRGLERFWQCNVNLLHSTNEGALKSNKKEFA
jgi:hypothetical protein